MKPVPKIEVDVLKLGSQGYVLMVEGEQLRRYSPRGFNKACEDADMVVRALEAAGLSTTLRTEDA